ncbi:MAG: tetratricopeptide repeat protein [Myxococcales bacterium]|nr:tetratricopeptide repeat protein [Myxococcales bacterium]
MILDPAVPAHFPKYLWLVTHMSLLWAAVTVCLTATVAHGAEGPPSAPPLSGQSGEAQAMAVTEPLQQAFSEAVNAGNYAKALDILGKVLHVWLQHVGGNHAVVGNLRVNIAEMQRQLGQLPQAEAELQTAIAVLVAALGPDHPQALVARHNLGAVQLQQRRFTQAIQNLEIVEVALTKARGDGAVEVAQARMLIADAKLQLGQIAPAKALYAKVMAVLDARPVPSAENLAVALNNQAKLHRTLGDLPAAEADLARAAQILGKVFGLGHPTLGLAAINLAELRLERGDLALAEEALRQAIAVSAAALGKGHPQVGYGALLLANLYRTRGENARAKSLYDEVLARLESAHGADHPALAEALNHAGVQALGAGNTGRAHQLLDRAWKILLRPENLSHSLRPTLAQNLATVMERGGDSDGAQQLLNQAIVACDRQAGVEMECASPRYNLGLLHLRARRLPQAQLVLQAALAARVKHGGQSHPEVARSLVALASLLDLQGKTAMAAELLEQATAIRERQLALALAGGADGPKRALVATLAEERDWVLDVLLRAGRHGAAWELIVQRKGRALEAMVDGMRGTGADPVLRQELAAARSRLAAV